MYPCAEQGARVGATVGGGQGWVLGMGTKQMPRGVHLVSRVPTITNPDSRPGSGCAMEDPNEDQGGFFMLILEPCLEWGPHSPHAPVYTVS